MGVKKISKRLSGWVKSKRIKNRLEVLYSLERITSFYSRARCKIVEIGDCTFLAREK